MFPYFQLALYITSCVSLTKSDGMNLSTTKKSVDGGGMKALLMYLPGASSIGWFLKSALLLLPVLYHGAKKKLFKWRNLKQSVNPRCAVRWKDSEDTNIPTQNRSYFHIMADAIDWFWHVILTSRPLPKMYELHQNRSCLPRSCFYWGHDL